MARRGLWGGQAALGVQPWLLPPALGEPDLGEDTCPALPLPSPHASRPRGGGAGRELSWWAAFFLWHNRAHCLPAVVEGPWSHHVSASSRQWEHRGRAGGRESGPFPPQSHLCFPWRETRCVSFVKVGGPTGKGMLVAIPVELLLARRWEGLAAQTCEGPSGVDARTFLGFYQGSCALM